jgi:hypothetical protein
VPAVVMTTNVLNSQYEFIYQAFQNTAVFPFLLLGTVMVLVWVAQRFRYGWIPSVLVAAVVTIQALTYGYSTSPGNIRWAVAQIQPGPAHQIGLALDQTPADAEVITTIAIIGRFSARPSVYWFAPTRTVPIQSRHVVFVLDPANENTIPNANSADDAAAVTYLGSHLHGRVLVNADGIWAFEWQPPPGTTHFTFPATPPA